MHKLNQSGGPSFVVVVRGHDVLRNQSKSDLIINIKNLRSVTNGFVCDLSAVLSRLRAGTGFHLIF